MKFKAFIWLGSFPLCDILSAIFLDRVISVADEICFYSLAACNASCRYFLCVSLLVLHNDKLRLAKQNPNTNYIISQQNVEIANLIAKNYTLLDVNILASTQFINLKLWEFICIALLYLHTKFWANLKHDQKFG